ncbi:hypothetical protein B0H13DRAFT_2500594 [Mycena leptocephala]|nr:hypothetical protein B0H13DRAFT_2500594 [Mycena leptocephala]
MRVADRLFGSRVWELWSATNSIFNLNHHHTMIHITLALVSCFASLLNRADGLRCRLVTSSQRLLDGVVVVVVGALKTNVLENYNNVHLQLPAPPTKTLPTYIPASPTSFVPYSPPSALFLVLAFLAVVAISILSAALAKLGVLQAVRKSLAKAKYSLYDGVKTFFVFFVSIPLFVTAKTSKIYTRNGKIHVSSGKRRNGTRRLSLVFFGRSQATTALLNAYGRIVVAIVAGLDRVLELSGYHAHLVQPSQVLPGSTCILHPELPWFDIPDTDALNTPLPRRSCPEFWGSRSWKGLTGLLQNVVDPTQLHQTSQLGSGAFGDVIKVWSEERGESLAVKRISKVRRDCSTGSLEPFSGHVWHLLKNEILVHSLMADNPAFPNLYGAFHDQDHYYLVMECGGASFVDLAPPDRVSALSYGWELANALRSLHEHGVVHLDLKPDNLLIGADDRVILIDYGLVHVFDMAEPMPASWPRWHSLRDAGNGSFPLLWPAEDNPQEMYVGGGTLGYICPPGLLQQPCSYGADLWAFGMEPDFEEYTWLPGNETGLRAVDVEFFKKIFAFKSPLRFESWREIEEHPIWDSLLHPPTYIYPSAFLFHRLGGLLRRRFVSQGGGVASLARGPTSPDSASPQHRDRPPASHYLDTAVSYPDYTHPCLLMTWDTPVVDLSGLLYPIYLFLSSSAVVYPVVSRTWIYYTSYTPSLFLFHLVCLQDCYCAQAAGGQEKGSRWQPRGSSRDQYSGRSVTHGVSGTAMNIDGDAFRYLLPEYFFTSNLDFVSKP